MTQWKIKEHNFIRASVVKEPKKSISSCWQVELSEATIWRIFQFSCNRLIEAIVLFKIELLLEKCNGQVISRNGNVNFIDCNQIKNAIIRIVGETEPQLW